MLTAHQKAIRRLWSDPKFREKVSAGLKRAWQDGRYDSLRKSEQGWAHQRQQANAVNRQRRQEQRQQRIATAVAAYNSGATIDDISETIPRSTLYTYLRSAGVKLRLGRRV